MSELVNASHINGLTVSYVLKLRHIAFGNLVPRVDQHKQLTLFHSFGLQLHGLYGILSNLSHKIFVAELLCLGFLLIVLLHCVHAKLCHFNRMVYAVAFIAEKLTQLSCQSNHCKAADGNNIW